MDPPEDEEGDESHRVISDTESTQPESDKRGASIPAEAQGPPAAAPRPPEESNNNDDIPEASVQVPPLPQFPLPSGAHMPPQVPFLGFGPPNPHPQLPIPVFGHPLPPPPPPPIFPPNNLSPAPFMLPPQLPHLPPPPNVAGNAAEALQYYESQMRDHAAAYANAAAGAAWAAMQVATSGQPLFMPSPNFFPESRAAEPPAEEERPPSRRKRSHQRPPRIVTTTNYHTFNAADAGNSNNKGRRRLRSDNDSSSSGTPRHRYGKKKQRSDESLMGKTSVAALYEWCSKRQVKPLLETSGGQGTHPVPLYTVTVTLENDPETVLGTGEAATLVSAKQLAARKAMEHLVPGVVFCPVTNIALSLPGKETTSEDSLAHLTRQQLAIGKSPADSKKRPSSALPKMYPGTSTTTSEDEDHYFSATGNVVCSSLLYAMIQIDPTLPENPVYTYAVDETRQKIRKGPQRGTYKCTAQLQKIKPDGTVETLETTGVGSNKRQSRHGASAQMLALLFPDCSDMVQVQAAAEAAREAYAKGRDRKEAPTSGVAMGRVKQLRTRKAVGDLLDSAPRAKDLVHQPPQKMSSEVRLRQSTRLLQLENLVDHALHRLYDEHEALPEKLTEDDVGRTVLRRASPEDLPRIRKLLLAKHTMADEELTARWWSTASFVLVLCRAIAALEDPPLGCAVLRLGFDADKGKVLRVSQIGNEPHLPQERLVECLQTFAVCMNTTLIPLNRDDDADSASVRSIRASGRVVSARARDWPLQSVQEEEETESSSSSSSSMERRSSTQQSTTKPSKRTRRL